jgi:hypothetical protein
MSTKWKQIKGFEDKYRISSEGEVQNLHSGKFLKASPLVIGYSKITLLKSKRCRETGKKVTASYQYLLHRLVAEHFIPNPTNKPRVTHIDGDYSNNSVGNLKWVTDKEVGELISVSLTGKSPKGEAHHGSKLTEEQAKLIKQNVGVLSKKKLASLYKVSESTIAGIRSGRAWKHV